MGQNKKLILTAGPSITNLEKKFVHDAVSHGWNENFDKYFRNLENIGPKIENHELFPEKVNVTFASIVNKEHIAVRVWERGAGITKACGTGACAAAAAAHLLELTDRNIDVKLDGGTLGINWQENGDIIMSGPTAVSFRGYWEF